MGYLVNGVVLSKNGEIFIVEKQLIRDLYIKKRVLYGTS